jgi:hypothetical protein
MCTQNPHLKDSRHWQHPAQDRAVLKPQGIPRFAANRGPDFRFPTESGHTALPATASASGRQGTGSVAKELARGRSCPGRPSPLPPQRPVASSFLPASASDRYHDTAAIQDACMRRPRSHGDQDSEGEPHPPSSGGC